jgi:serine/threonine protein kinase/ABC-type phosphate transport system substrate-binding protein
MSDLLEGVQLSDFLLIQCINRGGVADIYRGRHVGLGGGSNYDVAVKVFRPGYAQRQSFHDYYMTEADKIGQFEHPNILPFLEFGEGEGLLYSVTPFIESGTLGDLLSRVGGKFPAMQALPIMQQLCSAVQYAHERDVIHGNIKLSNVFVGTDGRMLLADFGIVRGYDDSQQSLTRVGWGSAEYAAPEQSLGVLRHASDIYALGALLFRILTGQPPFTGQTPVEVLLKHVRLQTPSARSIEPTVSDTVDGVLQRAMQKRSDERFTSAQEFFEALQMAVMVSPVASPVARAVPAITRQLTHSNAATAGSLQNYQADAFLTVPPPPSLTPETPGANGANAPDAVDHFNRSGLFNSPFRQMSPIDEPVYKEDIGVSNASRGSADNADQKHFLQDDAGTHIFWSVDPLEWSPIGNEQVGSVPLTAEEYLQSMPVAPRILPLDSIAPAPGEEPVSLPVVPEQLKKTIPLSQPVTETKVSKVSAGRRKNLLPALVVVLLLIGLLGALLSSFLYPGPSGSTSTVRPGAAVTQAPGATTTPVGATTPTGASVSPVAGSPTAAATTQPSPNPSPTPVPIPTNPAVPQFSCASGSLTMDGSASFIPAIQQLTSDYNNRCSNNVSFNFSTDDSQTGLNGLMNGSVGLAYSDLPSSGRPGLVDYQVAALIFAVVVNSDTQVTNLTTAQLQGIYSGHITNWSQVGGSNEPILIITQPPGSTLRTIFETYVLDGTAQTVPGFSSAASITNVSGGITYMPLADAPSSGSAAQAITINGIGPTASMVKSGAYPFWSVEHLYTDYAAQGVALSFIAFCLNSLSASDFANSGSVPYAAMSDTALRTHLPGPTI